jgi:hypothetical protein
MNFRLVLRSTDSVELYPDNTPWDFWVQLPKPLVCNGSWTIALLEITSRSTKVNRDLYVYCNVCENTIVGDREQPLLRRVFQTRNWNNIYEVPYEVSVRLGEIQSIHVYIRDVQGNPASFLKDGVTVTLRLKRNLL